MARTVAHSQLVVCADSNWTRPHDSVFADPATGRPIARTPMMRRYRAALAAASLDPAFRFHNLRHTFGTSMARAVDPVTTIQEWLGHSDLTGSTCPLAFATVELPETIDVSSLGIDPANSCGDAPSATTKDYTVETSPDGANFTVAKIGPFERADAHHLNTVTLDAGSRGVRYLRVTLLTPQNNCSLCSGLNFIDMSEFEVYGGTPNTLPAGTLSAEPASVRSGEPVSLTASFRDPDSAITGYGWDFDGDGAVDRTTAEPTTSFSYAGTGTFAAAVQANDFRGGFGSASTPVTVAADAPPGEPISKKPKITLRRAGPASVRLMVACEVGCSFAGELIADRRTADQAGIDPQLRQVHRALIRGGTRTETLAIRPRTSQALLRRGIRRLRLTALASAGDAEDRRAEQSKRFSFRLSQVWDG